MGNLFSPIPWVIRTATTARSRKIMGVFARYGLRWAFSSIETEFRKGEKKGRISAEGRRYQARQLCSVLTELGATFIKVGQAFSARADLIPREYTEELCKLQDDVPSLPFGRIEPVIYSDFRQSIEQTFLEFNPIPIASASIGQVYRAKLFSGETVAVKVVRPGVVEQIEEDLAIMMDVADWVYDNTEVGKRYQLPLLVEEIAYTIRNECNYIREGRNLDQFRELFHDDPKIHVPRVYWEYTTPRILTMEYVDGLKITDLMGLNKAGINPKIVSENLMHFALCQLFGTGIYNADPHPGNFFVRPDGSLAVVDFGMVSTLSADLQDSLLQIGSAIQRKDPDLFIDALMMIGSYPAGVNQTVLRRDVFRLLEKLSPIDLREMTARKLVGDIFGTASRHGLLFPTEMVNIARAFVISEGTGLTLCPELKIFEFARPYIQEFAARQRSLPMMVERMNQTMQDGVELGMEMPQRLHRILGKIERGQLEVNLNMEIIHKFSRQMQQMTNRLSLSMLLSATIIALGLVMVVYKPEAWQTLGDWVFGLAFVSSILFGLWLIWSFLRSNKP